VYILPSWSSYIPTIETTRLPKIKSIRELISPNHSKIREAID
jgi:hypothetical protein